MMAPDMLQATPQPKAKRSKFSITVRLTAGDQAGKVKTLSGRPAWALERLISAGNNGVTTSTLPPGVRWSHFVWMLRRDGFNISARDELHGGEFAGRHSRYYLETACEIMAQPIDGRAAA